MTDSLPPPAARDRYRALGLRHNPFAAPERGAPPLTAFVDRGLPHPPAPGSTTLVQVIGDSGLGKSTQLQHWRQHTPGPYHWIPRTPYAARWARPPQADDAEGIIYGDEIDRMPAPLRRRWFRQLARAGTTLVIGTHADLSSLGKRAGFSVVTHQLQPAGPELLAEMANRRLIDAACGPIPAVQFSTVEVADVAARCNGNPGAADELFHQLLAQRAQRRTAEQLLDRR
jgi:hypothetical protein